MSYRLILLALALMVVAVDNARAALIVDDRFNDGTRTVAPVDASESDIEWFKRESTTALTVATDDGTPGIGSGNALYVNGAVSGVGQPIIGVLPSPVTLALGDVLTLSFDFRFDSSTGTIGPNGTNFRFGLLDSNGSAVTADNQATSDNDRGYSAAIGTGGTNGTLLRDEDGTQPSALSGTDAAPLPTVGTTGTINDFLARSANFSITRTASGVDLAFTVFNGVGGSGGVLISGAASDNTGAFFTFDEIAFSQGFPASPNQDLDYRIDNVRLETVPVPEPSTMLLGGCAFVVLTAVSMRRR